MTETIVSVQPRLELPEIFFSHNAIAVEKTGFWYHNFEYAIEQERGFDFREDLFQPFSLVFDLAEPAGVIISTDARTADEIPRLESREVARREALIQGVGMKGELGAQLALAADQFIVRRGQGKTVIAGYPWFSDWGRDTMIALPGLTLATGRPEIARQILLEFSHHFSAGMIPNRFPDEGETPEYNTVDATLWYFEAARAYAAKTRDYDFIREYLYAKLTDSIVQHVRGTRYGIGVDDDGLLAAGFDGSQLTWMDAKVGDLVFTPRIGKPVEIQALWYNALMTMAEFAGYFGDTVDRERYLAMADKTRRSFLAKFWNEADGCLFDLVTPDDADPAVRPNQIFAVSLHYSMLSIGDAAKVVTKVADELLTPVGLRSLSPRDPNYRGVYRGSPLERDAAYHQGTVWAWPIGAFIEAYRRVHSNGHLTEKQIGEIISGFVTHLETAGLGQISEIFDGDAPHTPRGCPAQAWSVAEILRVL
jgi:predicted glycogen debranching enzyme